MKWKQKRAERLNHDLMRFVERKECEKQAMCRTEEEKARFKKFRELALKQHGGSLDEHKEDRSK